MEAGHQSDQGVVNHGCQEGIVPAVLIADGAQTVGIAKSYHNGLIVHSQGEAATQQGRNPTGHSGSHDVAQHNGPHIAGAGAGVAGAEHTEDQTEGDTVKAGTNQIVVSQNEQTKDTHIHQRIAQRAGNIVHLIPVFQQVPVVPGGAAHQQRQHHTKAEQNDAEDVHSACGGNRHIAEGTG